MNMVVTAVQKMSGGHSPDAAWIRRLMNERRAGRMAGRRESGILWRLSLIVSALMLLIPAVSSAEMAILADKELAGIVAYGFSSFTFDNGVARADLNINVSTYTEIDSLKLGYYNDGKTTGWDENWTNVRLGSDTEDLSLNGLYIEAAFENTGDPAARGLKSVEFGTADMTGFIKADFKSFSGHIGVDLPFPFPLPTIPISGHRLSLLSILGDKSVVVDHTGFHVLLDVKEGLWVHLDKATLIGL